MPTMRKKKTRLLRIEERYQITSDFLARVVKWPGRRVRRKVWAPGRWVTITTQGQFVHSDGSLHLALSDMMQCDWEDAP